LTENNSPTSSPSVAESKPNASAASPESTDSKTGEDAKKSSPNRRGRSRGEHSWDISQFKVEPQEGKVRFHDFDLPPLLMRGIQDTGFEYCTPIQGASLPHTLNGHDIVGKAQTGTGKTAAFLINTITDLLNHPVEGERFMGEARTLILAPTRELAIQIADDAVALL